MITFALFTMMLRTRKRKNWYVVCDAVMNGPYTYEVAKRMKEYVERPYIESTNGGCKNVHEIVFGYLEATEAKRQMLEEKRAKVREKNSNRI